MMRLTRLLTWAAMLATVVASSASAFSVGEFYYLERPGKTIPGHPGPGDNRVSLRFDHGAVAEILAFDQTSGWYELIRRGQ